MAKSKKQKAIEAALEAIEAAETIEEVKAAVADLPPELRNHKSISWPVHLAMERIISKSVAPLGLFPR